MANQDFSKAELERYSRHLILPEFNISGQRKLKAAKVLVVGCGGLGSPVLLYLAAAGVGTIGIVDFDVVDDSNLQRQVLYGIEDVGMLKVDAARKRLLSLNPHINIICHPVALNAENALDIVQKYDVVADGTDNFPTRYLVNDACVILGKTNVYASIFKFEGQVSVFNFKNKNGELGPNYRDLFPEPPLPGSVPSCGEAGVLGVLPGIIGSLQASEVIKVVAGIGEPLAGRLFVFDAKSFQTRTLKFNKNPNLAPISKLIDYEQFCGLTSTNAADKKITENMKTITVQDFKKLQESGEDFQLIDVREAHEVAISTLGGEHIPMGEVPAKVSQIATDKKVVIHCRTGGRSGAIADFLEKTFGMDNVYNLVGGINAYAQEIDTSLPTY